MNGYFRAMLTVPYGYLKLGLIKAIHFDRLSFGRMPRVSLNTELTLDKGARIKIGNKLNMRGSARIRVRESASLTIGNNAYINVNSMIVCHDNIEIGDDVQFGPNVQIYDHDHDYRAEGGVKAGKYKTSPVKIGNNVWIGANAVILRGTIIGDNCVVAAGTVVHKGIYQSNSLIYNKNETVVRTLTRNY